MEWRWVMGGPTSYSTGNLPPLNGHTARVRIVADSASDILPSHARALGILLVPNRIVFDGAVWRDGVDLTAAEFYAALPRAKTMPHTIPAPPEDLYTAYQWAFRQGATDVVSLHVSGKLSKVAYHAIAARDAMPGAPIRVVDTQQAGIGMWPAVTRAAQLAQSGVSAWEIEQSAAAILKRTRAYFMVESLEYLRRNGRIGRAREMMGSLLDAHPILTFENGEVAPVENVRPRQRALERMCELALEGDVDRLLVCGTSIEAITEVEEVLRRRYKGPVQNTWLGPTLGANTGPAVAVACVSR